MTHLKILSASFIVLTSPTHPTTQTWDAVAAGSGKQELSDKIRSLYFRGYKRKVQQYHSRTRDIIYYHFPFHWSTKPTFPTRPTRSCSN